VDFVQEGLEGLKLVAVEDNNTNGGNENMIFKVSDGPKWLRMGLLENSGWLVLNVHIAAQTILL